MDLTAYLLDRELRVRIEGIEPRPDMMLTQAITSPCLLLEIPAGDYRRIVALDQRGNLRGIWSSHPDR